MSRGSESSLSRDPQASSSQYSFPTPMQLDANASLSASGQNAPPFDPTKVFGTLRDRQSNEVQPEIHAKIDKGFFQADSAWTCYRRNYFSVACSYSFKRDGASNAHDIYLARPNAPPELVQAFAMCIAAKVDGDDGKPIELVQHTPKRDKGPMSSPDKRELKPNPTGNLGMFTGAAGGAFSPSQGGLGDYDAAYPGGAPATDAQNVTNFERIQFKKATANNGKRRAAQQFFHIVVELFARVAKGAGGSGSSSGKSSAETEWVKVAHRVSAQMVVRGRSPGHYQDERRNSSSSMGPHGGHGSGSHHGGSDYGGGGGSGGSLSSSHHHGGMSGPSYSARLGSHGGYQGHRHLALSHTASDTHSIASSSASSMRSSLGPFSDHASSGGGAMPMDDVQPTGPANGYGGYYGAGGGYDNTRVSTAGMPALSPMHHHRPHAGDGGPPGHTLDPPYLPMPPLKEEPFSRAPSIKPEPFSRGGSDAFALPAFAGSPHGGQEYGAWGPSEPSRDCRSMLLETSKTYYPATQAL